MSTPVDIENGVDGRYCDRTVSGLLRHCYNHARQRVDSDVMNHNLSEV